MITTLLIIHGLLAVALLGAITHQALAVCWPRRKSPDDHFTGKFRAVSAPSYANAVVLLYLATTLLGAIIYPEFRVSIRSVVEELGQRAVMGAFEVKEHFVVVGMAMLAPYWYFWRTPLDEAHAGARQWLTALLAFIVWWGFLVGHIINNVRGYVS